MTFILNTRFVQRYTIIASSAYIYMRYSVHATVRHCSVGQFYLWLRCISQVEFYKKKTAKLVLFPSFQSIPYSRYQHLYRIVISRGLDAAVISVSSPPPFSKQKNSDMNILLKSKDIIRRFIFWFIAGYLLNQRSTNNFGMIRLCNVMNSSLIIRRRAIQRVFSFASIVYPCSVSRR